MICMCARCCWLQVLNVDQKPGDAEAKEQEEEEDSTETLVCTVLSALQKLGEHLETSKKVCFLCG